MKDYSKKTKDAVGLWNYHTATERQLVMDTILLMSQLESPTYVKQSTINKMIGLKDTSLQERF